MNKLLAEAIGTAWLVFGGCGSAVLAAGYPELGIGFTGVALAFGLTVVTMAYAIGHVSGCHLNPAVTVGLISGGRFDAKDLPGYVIAQVTGAMVGAFLLLLIASGKSGSEVGAFASNGFGAHSPGGYGFFACMLTEFILTFFFLFIILGVTHKKATQGFAGLAIGLGLTLIHLISIPVTNTSVNPARSTSQAVFAFLNGEFWTMWQLPFFWLAPMAGAFAAGVVYRIVCPDEE